MRQTSYPHFVMSYTELRSPGRLQNLGCIRGFDENRKRSLGDSAAVSEVRKGRWFNPPQNHGIIHLAELGTGSLRQAHVLQQVDITWIRVKGHERVFDFYVLHASRPLRIRFFQPLEGLVTVSHKAIVNRNFVG